MIINHQECCDYPAYDHVTQLRYLGGLMVTTVYNVTKKIKQGCSVRMMILFLKHNLQL